MKNISLFLFSVCILIMQGCNDPEKKVETEPVIIPKAVTLEPPAYMGSFKIPEDNPLTDQGIELGRMLFYETKLSKDNSISCASCHQQEKAFTDATAFSPGVNGAIGKRSAMALNNMIWVDKFFWDGRSPSLEDQVLHPIQDPLEMNQTLEEAASKLQADAEYTKKFKTVFGSEQISSQHISKALSQFIRTLISTNSKYDKYKKGEYEPTAQEKRGEQLFFTHPIAATNLRGGNCGDCHLGPNTGGDRSGLKGFKNNGLSIEFSDASDKGLETLTSNASDRGKFRVPSLRNIALTAPYMHDGRFKTLEEVLDHYNHPEIMNRPNVDILIKEGRNDEFGTSLNITEQEKQDIIAFLHMLTDEEFVTNPAFSNPHTQK